MNILQTRDLSFSYLGGEMAISDVNLTIPQGRKVVLLGPNGAGKSTLLLHLNGILKPTSGTVLFRGEPMRYDSKSLCKLRYQVAVVLQNPDDQIFNATVKEDVAFGPLNQGLSRNEALERVWDSLSRVGMEDLADRPIHALSFGQKKRVALAGALAMAPSVLIMDEPTAGLDPRMVHELYETIDRLNQDGLTVILSTHDIETAYNWADEIRVMDGGMMRYSGPPGPFFIDTAFVHSLGLVPPSMIMINKRLDDRIGPTEYPLPRTVEQTLQRIAPLESKGGKLILMTAADLEDVSRWEGLIGRSRQRAMTGVYGIDARRFASENRLHIDYHFNALDNCIGEVVEGRDFLMLTDDGAIGSIKRRLEDLALDYGIKIDHEVISGKAYSKEGI